MNESVLSRANKSFREKRYREAIEIYQELMGSNKALRELAYFNMLLAKKKLEGANNVAYSVREVDIEGLRREAVESRRKGKCWESAKSWVKLLGDKKNNSTHLKDIYQNINCMIESGALDQANYFIDEAIKIFPNNKILLQKKGRVLLKKESYREAKEVWKYYWETARLNEGFSETNPFRITNGKGCNDQLFVELTANKTEKKSEPGKVCIYTALFGEYDDLPPVLSKAYGVDFICFTDVHRTVPGWDVRVVEKTERNPVIENRKYKMLPHNFLSDYEYSCYVDSNILITSDFSRLINNWLMGNSFVAWRHPDRNDVYSEIEAIISNLRHAPDEMIQQYEYFNNEGMPSNTGMIEACFLWRSHGDLKVRKLMEKWWDFVKGNGNRDQPALSYLMWKERVRPKVLSRTFGNTRENDYFVKLKHKKTPLQTEGAERNKDNKSVFNKALNSGLVLSNKKIVWVYRMAAHNVASTVMRGKQLSSIVKERLRNVEVDYVNENSLDALKNSVVILTKGFLKNVSDEEISLLKKGGNIICIDYVDDPEKESIVSEVDVLIASSIRQFIHYKNKYPDKLCHMITHHVDPDIPKINIPRDKLRVAYFGELANAKWRNKLQDEVGFILTNTKTRGREWISSLNKYNCHYAVREKREIDGFKPFLKGFTAGACGANILIPKSEGDSRFYLTSDYPYLINDDSFSSVSNGLRHLRETFGSKEWYEGLDMMRYVASRSSFDFISKEVENLADELYV